MKIKDGRYKYMTTWLGENQNESDMAFYSTYPFDHLVGPGIGRGEYGGFLMSLPARRMYDVWQDPDYDEAREQTRAPAAGGAGLFLAEVCGVCGRQASAQCVPHDCRTIGRKIMYIPIGQLSPVTLKKIRVVHVLDGHEKRKTAKEYLW